MSWGITDTCSFSFLCSTNSSRSLSLLLYYTILYCTFETLCWNFLMRIAMQTKSCSTNNQSTHWLSLTRLRRKDEFWMCVRSLPSCSIHLVKVVSAGLYGKEQLATHCLISKHHSSQVDRGGASKVLYLNHQSSQPTDMKETQVSSGHLFVIAETLFPLILTSTPFSFIHTST